MPRPPTWIHVWGMALTLLTCLPEKLRTIPANRSQRHRDGCSRPALSLNGHCGGTWTDSSAPTADIKRALPAFLRTGQMLAVDIHPWTFPLMGCSIYAPVSKRRTAAGPCNCLDTM